MRGGLPQADDTTPLMGTPMGDVRRSGEYKLSPETEALIKTVKETAERDTRRDVAVENLTREVAENTVEVKVLAGQVTESNKVLAVYCTTQEEHGEQLKIIWEDKRSKSTAWHAMWPTVVGSIISAALLAIMAMSGVFTPKAPPTTPAPPTAPVP